MVMLLATMEGEMLTAYAMKVKETREWDIPDLGQRLKGLAERSEKCIDLCFVYDQRMQISRQRFGMTLREGPEQR